MVCLVEVQRFTGTDLAYDLSSTSDGGVMVSLQSTGQGQLAVQRADGSWERRVILGSSTQLPRRISAVSGSFVAIADSTLANVNTDGTSLEPAAGQCPGPLSVSAPNENEAWFGLTGSSTCSWTRDGGFQRVELSALTGAMLGSGPTGAAVNAVWVSPSGRRFFAGQRQLLVAERSDGGFVASTGLFPQFFALSGAGTFVVAVGQFGGISSWDETNNQWITANLPSGEFLSDVWVEREDLAWIVGSDGGASFIGLYRPDGGFTALSTNHSRSVSLGSIHGGPTGVYVLGRDRDAGVHVVFRVTN